MSWTSEFQIGDSVQVLYRPGIWGNGTVIEVEPGCLAVKHNNFDSKFHDCGGLCENGYGYWYFGKNLVQLVDNTPPVNLNLEEGLL